MLAYSHVMLTGYQSHSGSIRICISVLFVFSCRGPCQLQPTQVAWGNQFLWFLWSKCASWACTSYLNTLTEHFSFILLPDLEKEEHDTPNKWLATIRKITRLLKKLLIWEISMNLYSLEPASNREVANYDLEPSILKNQCIVGFTGQIQFYKAKGECWGIFLLTDFEEKTLCANAFIGFLILKRSLSLLTNRIHTQPYVPKIT